MRTNVRAVNPNRTHEGAPAVPALKPLAQLRRSVLSCLLWEREFYEDGQSIADRIVTTADQVPLVDLAALAVDARSVFHLRHAPLLLLIAMLKRGGDPLISETIAQAIQRPDELTELLSLYWRNGRAPLAGQLKKGLAKAFPKFDAYQLAKYNRDDAIKLRDVLFLCHAAPKDAEQAAVWKALVDGTLPAPDTWEVALSGGADKKATWERLLTEGKLGYLALLRNLRNMEQVGVDSALITSAILARKGGAHRVLPFRYVAAARHAPRYEPQLDQALMTALAETARLPGKTIALVDVSGSMDCPLSDRSDLTRMDAAAALASMVMGDVRVFTFSHKTVEVPPRRGMAGVDAAIRSQEHGATRLGAAVRHINALPHDRLIVITDEQSHDSVPNPVAERAYMINVASYQNGVGYGRWTHLDGFSEGVLRWIHEYEQETAS